MRAHLYALHFKPEVPAVCDTHEASSKHCTTWQFAPVKPLGHVHVKCTIAWSMASPGVQGFPAHACAQYCASFCRRTPNTLDTSLQVRPSACVCPSSAVHWAASLQSSMYAVFTVHFPPAKRNAR